MEIRIVVTLACALIAALSLPLVMRRVPPNRLYGFRTRRTLASADIWYPANAFSGKAMLAAAALTTLGTWLAPAHFPEWFPAALLVASVLAVLVASMLHLPRYR